MSYVSSNSAHEKEVWNCSLKRKQRSVSYLCSCYVLLKAQWLFQSCELRENFAAFCTAYKAVQRVLSIETLFCCAVSPYPVSHII